MSLTSTNESLYYSCNSSLENHSEVTAITPISNSSVNSHLSTFSCTSSINTTKPIFFNKLKNIYDRVAYKLDIYFTNFITYVSEICSKIANGIKQHYNNSIILHKFVDEILIKLFLLAIGLICGVVIVM